MRFVAYAGTSVALAAAIVLKALHSRPNFYSVGVYFAESNAALMILSNLVLLVIGSLLVGLQQILYGSLRPIETEQLYEKAWFAVTETCLAMTIFREDLGVWFVVMFVALLVAKVWGWIGEGRLEILEQQPPENPRLFHARLSTSLLLSMLFNVWLLNYCVDTVRRTNRASMMIMFAFEFALLNVSSLSTLVRYGITIQEAMIVRDQTNMALQARKNELEQQRKAAREAATAAGEPAPEEIPIEELLDEADVDVPGWEEKSRWIFYLDLTTDFLRLLLYVTFFAVLCKLYSMPIHIIRDVAMVVRSFYRRVTDFIKYRHATRDMHARYPDATAEEITTQDVCIICREGMIARAEPTAQAEPTTPSLMDERLRPKKLPCGHILHFACLRSWLERQQNCPTCRQPVLSDPTPPPGRAANGPANNNAAGAPQAQANANPAPAPAANDNRPHTQLNRLRTFSLGPLRLTVGTGRIVQRPPVGANQPAVAEANTHPNNTILSPIPNIQSPGLPTMTSLPESNTGIIQASINHLERMLVQDATRLRLQTEQMNVLRAWQAELNRLRTSQGVQQPSQMFAAGNITPTFPPHGVGISSISAFSADHGSEPIRSGSASLPPGVTIPEGWTLLPLQRLQEPTVSYSTLNPTDLSQPQQRSRSLGPSSQPLPAMNVVPATSNLSSFPVQGPLSIPSPIPIPTTTNISSSMPVHINSASSENQRPESSRTERTNNSESEAATFTGFSNLPPTQTETHEGTDSAAESSNTSGWRWPTSPPINTPTSTTNPKSQQESSPQSLPAHSADNMRDTNNHTATVEDAPEEE